MSLFSQKKTVVGLFDSDADVQQAVDNLQQHGFNAQNDTEVTVIDQNYLAETLETPNVEIAGSPNSGIGRTTPIGPANPLLSLDSEGAESKSTLQNTLVTMGLKDEEADYLARQVAGGSPLMVVKTGEKQAAQVAQLLEQTNARSFVS
jgi:hypothetical protein